VITRGRLRDRVLLLLLAGAVLLGLFGCGAPRSPGAAVRKFYGLMASGKYDAASRHLSAEARMTFAFGMTLVVGLSEFAGEKLGSMPIGRIEIIREIIRGDTAEVSYVFRHEDGSVGLEDADTLVKENGRWKITLSF
jgi:hypothetical protein